MSDKFRFEQWGRVKIRYALRAKGIDDGLIDESFDEKIDPDEWAYENKSPCLECGKKSCQWKKCVPYKWFISKTWRRVTEPFKG